MSRRFLALLAALAIAGCGGTGAPKSPPVKKAKATPAAGSPATEVAAATAPPVAKAADDGWVYSAAGRRDPFRSFLAEFSKDSSAFTSRCPGPLGKLELEQFRLVAVITGLEDPIAMVELPGGKGYVVRRGSCIGKNGGVVAAVRKGEVVVTERRVRADGTGDAIQTSLQLPVKQDPNLEE
jgi:type IV pilus assembly protein PilP